MLRKYFTTEKYTFEVSDLVLIVNEVKIEVVLANYIQLFYTRFSATSPESVTTKKIIKGSSKL